MCWQGSLPRAAQPLGVLGTERVSALEGRVAALEEALARCALPPRTPIKDDSSGKDSMPATPQSTSTDGRARSSSLNGHHGLPNGALHA